MGKRDIEGKGESNKHVDTKNDGTGTGTGTGRGTAGIGSSGVKNTEPRTETAGTGTGRGTGTGTGAGGNETKRTAVEETDKSVVLKQSPPKKVAVTIPETGEKVEPAKKKRSRKTTKKEADPSDLIKFMTAVNACIPQNSNFGILKLTETEIENIAKPLANILEKQEVLGKIAEKSDSIALVTAVIGAYAPRAIFVAQTIKVKKEKEKHEISISKQNNGNRNVGQEAKISKISHRHDGANETTPANGSNGNELFDILPPTTL